MNLVYCDKHSPGLLEDELDIISNCKLDVRLLVIINAITTLTVGESMAKFILRLGGASTPNASR